MLECASELSIDRTLYRILETYRRYTSQGKNHISSPRRLLARRSAAEASCDDHLAAALETLEELRAQQHAAAVRSPEAFAMQLWEVAPSSSSQSRFVYAAPPARVERCVVEARWCARGGCDSDGISKRLDRQVSRFFERILSPLVFLFFVFFWWERRVVASHWCLGSRGLLTLESLLESDTCSALEYTCDPIVFFKSGTMEP